MRMELNKTLVAGAALLGWGSACPARAQYRAGDCYVGLQAARQSYHLLYNGYAYTKQTLWPVYISLGCHAGRRLAFQVGLLYDNPRGRTKTSVYLNGVRQVVTVSEYQNEFNAAIPLAVRYNLAPKLTKVRVEGIVGLVFGLYGQDYQRTEAINGAVVADSANSSGASLNGYLTVGLGAVVLVGSRFEVTAEGAINRNAGPDVVPQIKDITASFAVGGRYRFSLRKNK